MLSPETVRTLALEMENVQEQPHHQVTSFRFRNKIFATLNVPENRACLKLSAVDQDVFCAIQKSIFYPVPNAWGKYGWTLVDLTRVKKKIFKDAMQCAYRNVMTPAKKKK